MEASHDRDIDWEIARLSGGLSAARRALPAHDGSLQPSDWDLDEQANGPMSERGDALSRNLAPFSKRGPRRPMPESIAPMAMDSAAHVEALPPHAVTDERKRPSGAGRTILAGVAGAMSVLALGLVLKAGLNVASNAGAARPVAASTTLAGRSIDNEGTPFASQPTVNLAPVNIQAPAGVPRSTTAPEAQVPVVPVMPALTAARAPIAARAAARAEEPALAEKPSIAALGPTPSAEISRSGASTAILVAGRRAAACAQPDDGHGSMPVSVTFAPSGRVTTAIVNGGPFAGTPTGSCIARALRGATVGPFEGGPVTVHGNVSF